ncbi:hypothetical protein V1512DRAFT_263549 [Lipomyces arxii]|uniref:uncharacterized protein n=1 Tax=Lipomyces arxii TaxID=56418 RepID=UPI0034CF3672
MLGFRLSTASSEPAPAPVSITPTRSSSDTDSTLDLVSTSEGESAGELTLAFDSADDTADEAAGGTEEFLSDSSWVLETDYDRDADNESDASDSCVPETHFASSGSREDYDPADLAEKFKDLGIGEQVVKQKNEQKSEQPEARSTPGQLTQLEASLLYAFAAYFCLNGPVGLCTAVPLHFECGKPYHISHNDKVSIRDVLQYRITNKMFTKYVIAVHDSLPTYIACPAMARYGRYWDPRLCPRKR